MNEHLLDKGHALLECLKSTTPDPNQLNALLQEGLACHSRMLELAETKPAIAIALAMAGAELLQAFQHHSPANAAIPEWVLVHEEQCCRYGAIWVHERLQKQQQPTLTQLKRCLDLLERLQQLHSEPIAWIAPMAQAFMAAIAEQESPPNVLHSTSDLRLVMVGNCQAHPLMLGIRKALPQIQIHSCPSVHLASRGDVAQVHQRLANADLLVMHRIQSGYRDQIGLDSDTLRQLLPSSARSAVLPNLHFEGHHPWIAYALDPDQRLAAIEQSSPLGPYHDFLAMAAARNDLPPASLIDHDSSEEQRQRLMQEHYHSLHELKSREADCDVRISDWLAANHHQIPPAHTINHPTQAILDQLLRRLLQSLNLTHNLGPELFDHTEHLGALSIPIHPWVAQALQLNSWASTWGRRDNQPFPIEIQLHQSYAFYRDHPWIAEANLNHPKFKLAEEILQATHNTNHSIRTRTTSKPSTAALINYYNDEDMLTWQLDSGCLDHYDQIYIWDGPYTFQQQLLLFSKQEHRLDTTAIGQRLLADQRVIYRYQTWENEAAKRIDAYNAVKEDIVVLHDTDEFFFINPERLAHFWQSPYAVASQYTQNLYAGGLIGSDAHHQSSALEMLPRKRVVFRRQSISPARHLDYCWLVGVKQEPTNETLVQPEAIGHAYHLTACRTTRGQAAKMGFYMSLSLAGQAQNPIVSRLAALVQSNKISQSEAQRIFLQGDPGYAGVPNPGFDLRLNERLDDPAFPQDQLQAILDQVNQMAAGSYMLLSGYPLHLWFPAHGQDLDLQLTLNDIADLQVQSWVWAKGQPAQRGSESSCRSDELVVTLPHNPDVLGWLLAVTVSEKSGTGPLHNLTVAHRG